MRNKVAIIKRLPRLPVPVLERKHHYVHEESKELNVQMIKGLEHLAYKEKLKRAVIV